jgi:riboflavin kinase/FMN adenylyltransferase
VPGAERDAGEPTRGASGALVAIGNFDGVHRGHQAVLADAASEAHARALEAVVLTFDPHPLQVLTGSAPPLLCTLERKIELIRRVSPALRVVAQRFEPRLAAQSPAEFASSVLGEQLRARVVLVGQNFRFGRDRAGDFDELVRLGSALGFEARVHELRGDAQGAWSSSRVREALARADLITVNEVLGRPHMLSGRVIEGDRRGRTIGFPTCNLGDVAEALPAHGVYAVVVDRVEERAVALARGVANVGVRPTVDPTARRTSVEVHLFDIDQDLYGAQLRVHFIQHLRPEQTFAGLAPLRAQIARDAEQARAALALIESDASAGGAWY